VLLFSIFVPSAILIHFWLCCSLRDGRSIRTVSALLLQLVQTSAHDVRIEARKIEQLRRNKLALKRQESFNDSQSQQAQNDPFLDETDQEVYLSLLFIRWLLTKIWCCRKFASTERV